MKVNDVFRGLSSKKSISSSSVADGYQLGPGDVESATPSVKTVKRQFQALMLKAQRDNF